MPTAAQSNGPGGVLSTPASVLFVCTANQCRSPIAEHMMRAAIGRIGLNLSVGSAGTEAVSGLQMHPRAAQVLDEHGVGVGPWQTTAVDLELIKQSDLILCAAAEHRRAIVTLSPAALRRTFTILEFARLAPHLGGLDADDPGLRAALPPHVAAARSKVRPGVDGDDVADPIGQRMGVFRSTGDLIAHAVDAVAAGFSTSHAFRHVTPATDQG